MGFRISKSGLANIKSIGYRRNDKLVGLPSPGKEQPKKVATKTIIRKVDLMTQKENPPSQRQIANRLKIFATTVNTLINK